MRYKLTILIAFVFLLAWSSNAFALQDTVNSKGKRIDENFSKERARPDEDTWEDSKQSTGEEIIGSDVENRDHVRQVPGESNNFVRSERNNSYYNEEIKTQEFDNKQWEKVTRDIDYSDDVYKRKKRKQWDTPNWSLGPIGAGGGFLKVLMFSLIIIALALVLYKMFGGSFVRNPKVGDGKIFSIEDIEDKLHESDLDRMLREALQKGDFRLAVRIYYLAIIKELSLKDWITWKKDKTNREYVNEIIAHKPELSGGFREATVAFERVWYGDMEIRENEFNMLSPRFRSFMESIQRTQ